MLPGREPAVPYSTVRPKLATGDLFFLETTSRVGRWIEKLEEQADLPPYSHVGMVIKDDVNLLLWDAPGGGDCFVDPEPAMIQTTGSTACPWNTLGVACRCSTRSSPTTRPRSTSPRATSPGSGPAS